MKIPLLSISKKYHYILSFVFIIFFLFFSSKIYAQAPFIEDFRDIINTIRIETTARHYLSFTLPINAEPINPTDYIQIRFPLYSDITLPTDFSGVFTGSPSAQLNYKTVLITGITVPPGGQIFINGITATNPISPFDFLVIMHITEDIDGNIIKNHASTIPRKFDGQIMVSAAVGYPTGEIQIDGYGSPLAYLIFNEDLNTMGTSIAGLGGTYSKIFSGIPPGTHSFSFFGIDSENRNTSTISVDISTQIGQRSLLLNQLLSPTIQVDDVSIEVGEAIYASGSAYPNSTITIFTDSPLRSYSTTASSSGEWTYSITDTDNYAPGDYRLYTIAQTQAALQSIFSPAILFTITSQSSGVGGTACGDISKGDLNCDSSVNIIDFSILMYYWGTDSEAADINIDGVVGLVDLSVMMYFWGT